MARRSDAPIAITQILVDHYENTYQLVLRFWDERNRLFLILLAIIVFGVLLTYAPNETFPLLAILMSKLIGIEGDMRSLQESLPFALVQSVLLLSIFYLMVNLFHRSVFVLNTYMYLGLLEKEIRSSLKSSDKSISFSRESSFYWRTRPKLLGSVKWFYIFLLGTLLTSFIVGKVVLDFSSQIYSLVAVDLLVGIPTLIFFFGYAFYSASLDRENS